MRVSADEVLGGGEVLGEGALLMGRAYRGAHQPVTFVSAKSD